MPGGDRTGPEGMGPRTGRGMGYCAGYNQPGYLTPGPGMGRGRGWGRGGGRGRGWGWRGTAAPAQAAAAQAPGSETEALRDQVRQLQESLDQVMQRLEGLEQ